MNASFRLHQRWVQLDDDHRILSNCDDLDEIRGTWAKVVAKLRDAGLTDQQIQRSLDRLQAIWVYVPAAQPKQRQKQFEVRGFAGVIKTQMKLVEFYVYMEQAAAGEDVVMEVVEDEEEGQRQGPEAVTNLEALEAFLMSLMRNDGPISQSECETSISFVF